MNFFMVCLSLCRCSVASDTPPITRKDLPRREEAAAVDATRQLAGKGFKGPWPPLIKMDETVRKKIDALLGK